MQTPFMYDNKKNTSTDVKVVLDKSNEGYILTLKPNAEWLNNNEREYPITLDPAIYTDYSGIEIYTVPESLSVSNLVLSKQQTAFLKFNLPKLSSSQVVTKADFNGLCDNSLVDKGYIYLRKVTSPWSPDTISSSNLPQIQTKIEDYQKNYYIKNGVEDYYFDMTNVVRSWYSSGNNYGVQLSLSKDASEGQLRLIEPYLIISYMDNSGLNNYSSYHTQDIGRAGTAYVNDFTGNLILSHNDMSSIGNRMPVKIKHIYSTSETNNLEMKYGQGWILNLNETIKLVTVNSQSWYEYIDEDRVKHNLTPFDSKYYKDENGEEFQLMKNTDGTIKIIDENKVIFNFNTEGNLASKVDTNGNQITLKYEGTKLVGVTDGVGRTMVLEYSTDGKLSSIADSSNRKISYIYNGNQLINIIYPDGKKATYVYDAGNKLISVINCDGYKIDYTYYSTSPYRVQSVKEGNIDGTQGSQLNVSYDYNMTIYTDNNQRKNIYQFDAMGKTISVRDDLGNAQYYKFGGPINSTNLTCISKLQTTTANYLQDHNAELESYWKGGGTEDSLNYGKSSSVYTTEDKYLGNKSLKVIKGSAGNRHYFEQSVNLTKGKAYTLSAYVKTVNISKESAGACISVKYYDGTGNVKTVDSQYISESSDWQRIDLKFTIPADAISNVVYVDAGILNETGTAYFDGLQLEDGSLSNRYNLVENSDLTYGTGTPTFWNSNVPSTSYGSLVSEADNTHPLTFNLNRYKINGKNDSSLKIFQNINVQGKQGDTFTFGGWAKGESLMLKSNRKFELQVEIKKIDGTVQKQTAKFNEATSAWQYITDTVCAEGDYNGIIISALYDYNANVAYFDGFQLYKEQYGDKYSYDSLGNIKTINSIGGSQTVIGYNENNNIQTIADGKGTSTFEYDSKNNLIKNTSNEGVINSYTYDSYGNIVMSKTGEGTSFIETSTDYTANGNYVKSKTDSLGNTILVNYNETKGLMDNVIDAKNQKISYNYDENNDLLNSVSSVVGGKQISNSYTYENDRIKTINHNGFNYTFDYDSIGNNTGVSVGNQKVLTNNYEISTGRLLDSTYGNGQKVGYDYDKNDRVIGISYNDSIRYKNEYDASGNIGYHEDLVNGMNYKYEYDLSNKLKRILDSRGRSISFLTEEGSGYAKVSEKVDNKTYDTTYAVDKDGRPKSVIYTRNTKNILSYEYDTLGRLSSKGINSENSVYKTSYSYVKGVSGATSNSVESIMNGNNALVYTYDKNGNIETINENGKVIKYYYDEQNELIREDNQVLNKTISYTYDLGGNIVDKKEYSYTTGSLTGITPTSTIPYSYGDTNWKDKLTEYNGKAITYDTIGNPLAYDGYTYTWEMGRSLKSISKTGLDMSFKYNENGIRTEKIVNGKTTKYYLSGDKVTYETDDIDKIYYTYDSDDNLVSMNLNGIEYYYIRNVQGDIIGLIDNLGAQVVNYTYDSWGKLISTTGILKDTVGVKNPYLYRGYRYDRETGLYYLQSRYYNAEIGRFINADVTDILQVVQGQLLGSNLFAYCCNNPINSSDPSGYMSLRTAGLIIDGIILVLNLFSAFMGLKATIQLIKFVSKEAVRATKKKIIQILTPVLGTVAKAVLGFSVGAANSIASYACDLFLNMSLGLAIASAIYRFVPASHRILSP